MKKLNLICILLALGSCAELEKFITGEEKPLSEEEFRNYSKMGANNYCNSRKTKNCEEYTSYDDKKFCEEFTALDCNCVVNSLYPKLTFEELKKLHNNAFTNFPGLDKFDYIGIDLNELIYNTKYGYSSVKKCVSDYVINDIKKDFEKDLRNHIQEVLSSKLIEKKEEEFAKNFVPEETLAKKNNEMNASCVEVFKLKYGNQLEKIPEQRIYELCQNIPSNSCSNPVGNSCLTITESLLEKQVYGLSKILPVTFIERTAYTPKEIWDMSTDINRFFYEYEHVFEKNYARYVDDTNLISEDRADNFEWSKSGYYYDIEITRKTFFTKAEEDKILKLWSINDRFKDAENGNITFFETPVNVEKYLLSSEIQKKLEKPQINTQTCYYTFLNIRKYIEELGEFKSPELEIQKACTPVKKEIYDYKKDIIEWAKEKGIY